MRRVGALVCVLVGCSSGATTPSSPDGGAATSLSAIASHDPLLAHVVARSTFTREAGRFTTGGLAGDVRASIDDEGAATIGVDEEHSVRIALANGRKSTAVLEAGRVEMPEAIASGDLSFAATPGRVEVLLLLRSPEAGTHASFTFERSHDLPTTKPDGKGGVTFFDGRGRARLHVPAPYVVDARGTRRDATLTLGEHTLDVDFDAAGLVHPILLDPGFETQRWIAIGAYDETLGYRPYPADRVMGTLSFDTNRKALLGFGGYQRDSANLETRGHPTGALRLYAVDPVWRDWNTMASAPDGYAPSFPASTPPFVAWGWSAAFDVDRQKLVAIGSRDAAGTVALIQEWDSTTNTWSAKCSSGCAGQPTAALKDPLVVYDETRKLTLAIPRDGGTMFAWNGASWATRTGVGASLVSVAWNAKKNVVLAIGGAGTYEWNGTAWTKVSGTGFSQGSLAFDRARGRGVAFGAGSGTTSKTWEWDGASWFVTVDGSTGATAPLFSDNTALGFDQKYGRIVLWGGGNGQSGSSYDSGSFSAQIWEYQSWAGACASDADCDGGSCRDGYCCATTCGACATCGATGSVGTCKPFAGAAGTGTEHDVCTGTKACNAAGACTKKIGEACVTGADCTSGNCVDGYCCNTACTAGCEVCNATPGTCTAAPKGSGGRVGCGAALCDGTSHTCATSCTSDADCSSTGYCNGTTCVSTLSVSATCARDRMCASGSCRDGVCCGSACNGACQACSVAKGATKDGTCTNLPATTEPAACLGYKCSGTSGACATSCTTDASCAAGNYCDGAFCQPARKLGDTCTRTSQCATGATCADGVCCNAACSGTCEACAADHKESGDASGTCGPAKSGTDPGDKCPATAASTCGTTGVCGKTGTCALWPAGAACGTSAVCDGGFAKGTTCDGLGTCKTDMAGVACAPGTCKDGGCVLACTTDSECDAKGWCDGGTCRDRAADGGTCSAANQCLSGHCADGVCCASACDGICERCDGDGTKGTCTAVQGKPREGHGECPGPSATDPCTAAACDGDARTSCKGLAGPEVKCREGTCTSETESLEAVCDGSGICPASTSKACSPFACGDTKCKDKCTADTDCKRGFSCDLGTGKCFFPATCDGDHTLTGADGRITDCVLYKCTAEGCRTSCATSDECANGAVCDAGLCVAGPPPEGDGGGCAASGRSGSSVFQAFALLLGAGLLRRRLGGRA
jgi:hypothetical protein